MFALSKGNKRKWVNGIEMHYRTCLASLGEQAQRLCHCVHAVGDQFRDMFFIGVHVWWGRVSIH